MASALWLDIHGPRSRILSILSLADSAFFPYVSQNRMPWYPGAGSVNSGNLPEAPQSKWPPSITEVESVSLFIRIHRYAHTNPAHARSMAANPLRAYATFGQYLAHDVGLKRLTAMSDDICTTDQRSLNVSTHAKGIVNDQRNPMFMTNIGNGSDIGNTVLRVGDGLYVDTSCFRIDGLVDIVWIVTNDPLHIDLELPHINSELIISAAVQPAGADKVVSRLAAVGDCHELRPSAESQDVRRCELTCAA